MTTATQYTSSTRNGVETKIAYRRLGRPSGTPLIMHIHFRANMDFWDPLLLAALATARPVIIFDQAGVGRSTGTVPETYQGWADDLLAFATAIGVPAFDLFGFSMGGKAVQMAALTAPARVKKLIVAGSDASAPPPTAPLEQRVFLHAAPPQEPIIRLAAARDVREMKAAIAYSFFYNTAAGRGAADEYWARISAPHAFRAADEEIVLAPLAREGTARQGRAGRSWQVPGGPGGSISRLGELKMPVLVMNGDDDLLIPSIRSWDLVKGINAGGEGRDQEAAGAKLLIWPRAGHGFLWQYAEEVGKAINDFLDDDGSWSVSGRGSVRTREADRQAKI